ncbi:metallophosphoesterase [Nannocystis radixulma]|uniref:Metallophosphoesterase n=1 Tax=Nannocystis radixulma TaxID=2995305 RepID=A0ABT5BJ23_9BACT|nr:metallophosphoesterase [Nannocystis radixulma]MDC0673683.1 metallophosphoesterase [Nannocystis radixulma]
MQRPALVLALSACSLSACVSDVGADVPGATETTTTGSSTTTTGAGGSTVVGPTTMPDAVTSTAGATSTGDEPPAGKPTDPNLLVALVGDQGSGSNTRAVYRLIADEGADMLIVLGDYDYKDDPDAWAAEMEDVLGDSFPVFAVVGNHDVEAWDGYQAKLQERLAKVPGASCDGELGVQSSCHYRGLHFLLSGFGTLAFGAGHEQWLADTLAADDSLWSLCAWHKNQRDLQAGDKGDEVTWQALRNCQDNAAIVVMGHEHSYARTRTLTDLGNAATGHGAVGLPELMEVGNGRTFTACSGLGGASIRDYDPDLHDDDTWWSTIYSGNYHRRDGEEVQEFSVDYGVLFMRFHVGGDPAAAHGYFKNIQGEVLDEFDVLRTH